MFGKASRAGVPATRRFARGGAILAAGFLLAGCVGGVGGQSPTAAPSMPASPSAPPPVPASPSAPPSTAALLTPVPGPSASSGATDCVSLNIDYAPDARGKAGDLVALARTAIAGLQAGDVVERGEPTDVGSDVQVVRAGAVIATLVYFPDQHGGWLLSSGDLCGGLSFKS